MGLRMKSFIIIGVHWKAQFLGRGSLKLYRGNHLKSGDLDSLHVLGGLDKKEGGGVIPKCTLCLDLANLLYAIEVDDSTRDWKNEVEYFYEIYTQSF